MTFVLFAVCRVRSFFSSISRFGLFGVDLASSIFGFSASSLRNSLAAVSVSSPSSSRLKYVGRSHLTSVGSLAVLHGSSSGGREALLHVP